MTPADRAALLTPVELAAVRAAVAEEVRANPVWTAEAAETVAQMIEAGDADDSRGMIFGLAAALAMKNGGAQ